MLDRLTSMAVFVEAAEAGSFAGAADALGLSAQMVAKHVAALERHLDVRLLNRTTRKQRLTEFGEVYLERCRAVLAEVAAADALAVETQLRPTGILRINAPVTFGRYGLMPVVARYMEQYPDVSVAVTLSDRLADPLEEGFEAVVRIGTLDDNLMLVARPLKDYQLVACASPGYIKRHGMPLQPADLAEHQCLAFAHWPAAVNRQWIFRKAGSDDSVVVSSRLALNDWGALHSAALAGCGVILGYEVAVAGDLACGRLVRVLPTYEGPSRPMHVIYPTDRRMTPKLRLFVEHMIDAFGAP